MKLILKEVNLALSADSFSHQRYGGTGMEEEISSYDGPPIVARYDTEDEEEGCSCGCESCSGSSEEHDEIEIIPQVLAGLLGGNAKLIVIEKKNKKKKKKKRDRCTTMAANKFDAFPSYNAASAIARCRRGEIWKKKKK